MAKAIVTAARDGKSVELPADLDALMIKTGIGTIYIDLEGVVQNMVLMRTSATEPRARLIMSPMESGRLAVGIIKA